MPDFNLPYIIDYSPFVVERVTIFCVAVMTAVLASAEGQAFMGTVMGDVRKGATDRLHFNIFLHLSILGTLCFFIAGFGWAKVIDIDPDKLGDKPRLRLLLCRLAGPIANLLLASIAASLSWILGRWGMQDQVFSTVVLVNVSMALYSLLPIPPLPGGALLFALFPRQKNFDRLYHVLSQIGPFVLVGFFLAVRLAEWDGVARIFNPMVSAIATLLLSG